MPQINIYNYLSQTSWVLLLFIYYYINMKQLFLPSLLEIIKIKLQLKRNKESNITYNISYNKPYIF